MEDRTKLAERSAAPGWVAEGVTLPGAKRASWAFRLLPALSQMYRLCERTGVLEVRAFRLAYAAFYFHYKRFVEDPFHGLVATRPDLFRGGNVVDVGAHIGYTTSLFLGATGPGSRVFAIEPDAANARGLRETARRLDAQDRVVVVEAAAGNVDGSVEFWHNPRHPGDHRVASEAFRARRGSVATRTVPFRRVDSVLAEHGAASETLAFVKIDVQGCELSVCEGLGAALDRSPRPAVAIEFAPAEIEEQGGSPDALLDFFRDRGHRLNLLTKDGRFRPLTKGLLDSTLSRRGYADLLCLPDGAD